MDFMTVTGCRGFREFRFLGRPLVQHSCSSCCWFHAMSTLDSKHLTRLFCLTCTQVILTLKRRTWTVVSSAHAQNQPATSTTRCRLLGGKCPTVSM